MHREGIHYSTSRAGLRQGFYSLLQHRRGACAKGAKFVLLAEEAEKSLFPPHTMYRALFSQQDTPLSLGG